MEVAERDPWARPREVVVIGAGISGLATAALLARDGYDVLVVEKNAEVGGRAGRVEREGFRWDTGPSWYLMAEVFDRFFAAMGTSAAAELDLVALDPAYRVWDGPGEPVDVHSGRRATALFEAREPGAGSRLDQYLDSGKAVYRLALDRFLYTSYAGPRDLFGAVVRPDVLRQARRLAPLFTQSLHAYVARRFRDPLLQKILDFPAVFLGGSPYRVPALYHMMSTLDLEESVLYPQGGFMAVVDALRRVAERAGAEIITETEVEAIKAKQGITRYFAMPESRRERFAEEFRQRAAFWPVVGEAVRRRENKPLVTGVRVRTDDGRLRVIPAQAVVAATDLEHVETALLRPEWQTYPAEYWATREPGPGGLVLLLGVRGQLPRLQHHNLLFTEDWQGAFEAIFGDRPHLPDPACLYICKPSATDAAVAPEGYENLFVLVPAPADTEILGPGSGERAQRAASAVIEQIAQWTGERDLAGRVVVRQVLTSHDYAAQVHAWRGTVLGQAHTLRQSAMLRTKNRSRRVEGLLYAGSSTLPGIGVPMCLISGELAARNAAALPWLKRR